MPVVRFALLMALLVAVHAGWSAPVVAQYFGQNVVRYQKFDFQTLETEHFDIYYYYPKGYEGADVEVLAAFDSIATAAIDLTGNSSGNQVRGNAGNNILNGRGGRDELVGLGGQDSFLFDTALDATFNVDAILDFNVADDTILLDRDIFSSSLGLGNISAGELVIGPAALDANDRIIYDSTSGALSYDSDGVGGLLRPFDRRADDLAAYGFDITKTMLKTMRWPASCFAAQSEELLLKAIRAILIRCSRRDRRPMAFDDLQIVAKGW